MPYFGLYLYSTGFSAVQVGIVFALMQGTRLVSPGMLAWLSSHFDDRMRLIQYAALMTTLAFSVLLFRQDFITVLHVTFWFSFFLNALLPQFESITLTKLGKDTHAYSGIRLWGSVGFIATVVGIGYILDNTALINWPWLVFVCLVAIFLSSLLLHEKGRRKHPRGKYPIRLIIMKKNVLALFAVIFLVQASHGPYYAFFSILLDKLNYSETQIGQFWALGVIAEIVLFLTIKHVFKRVSLRFVLLLSIFLTIIRWFMLAWLPESLIVLLLIQTLHAASFGSFHVVCIQLIHDYFRGPDQDKGQALFSSVGYGAGGMMGGLMAGLLWDQLGEVWVFGGASLLCALALCIAWLWVETKKDDHLLVSADVTNPM
tara:strand:- start:199990 stop:201105 length:1116 start_codon:yes stop_codon:yes gene_type:complete